MSSTCVFLPQFFSERLFFFFQKQHKNHYPLFWRLWEDKPEVGKSIIKTKKSAFHFSGHFRFHGAIWFSQHLCEVCWVDILVLISQTKEVKHGEPQEHRKSISKSGPKPNAVFPSDNREQIALCTTSGDLRLISYLPLNRSVIFSRALKTLDLQFSCTHCWG